MVLDCRRSVSHGTEVEGRSVLLPRSLQVGGRVTLASSGVKDARLLTVPKGAQPLMTTFVTRLRANEDGQDVIEYALLAGLISLVAVAIILNVGTGVNGVWQGVSGTVGLIPAP